MIRSLLRPVEALGAALIGFVKALGGLTAMAVEALLFALLPPYRLGLFFKQMDFVGVGSIVIIAITGFFTGAVFTLQSNLAFRNFGAEGFTGATVALSLTRELSSPGEGDRVAARAPSLGTTGVICTGSRAAVGVTGLLLPNSSGDAMPDCGAPPTPSAR